MYQRVLLKLSGEALSDKNKRLEDGCISFHIVENTATQLAEVSKLGVSLGIVLGGGNIWRGRSSGSMDRNRADQMGMLATAINSIAMQDTLLSMGVPCTVLSAVEMPRFCDTYTSRSAQALLHTTEGAMGHIVIFSCGSGHPFFSTDTAAALRAAEIGADILLLAKNVDAIYSEDPNKNPDAIRYSHLSFDEVIKNDLKATDLTAITLCKENGIAIRAFGLEEENGIIRAVKGESIGTLIDEKR